MGKFGWRHLSYRGHFVRHWKVFPLGPFRDKTLSLSRRSREPCHSPISSHQLQFGILFLVLLSQDPSVATAAPLPSISSLIFSSRGNEHTSSSFL